MKQETLTDKRERSFKPSERAAIQQSIRKKRGFLSCGLVAASALVWLLLGGTSAQGTLTITTKTDTPLSYPWDGNFVNRDPISSTDLLEGLVPTETAIGFQAPTAGTAANLTDGTGARYLRTMTQYGATLTLDFALPTVAASANGFDITEIRFFTGEQNARKFQDYDVLARYYGETGAATHLIASHAVIQGSARAGTAQSYNTSSNFADGEETILTDTTGILAGRVDQLRFVLYPISNSDSNPWYFIPADNAFTMPSILEIDAFGNPVVPEPSVITLLLVGGLGLRVARKMRPIRCES